MRGRTDSSFSHRVTLGATVMAGGSADPLVVVVGDDGSMSCEEHR
jgi:hypothetical protein